jgi:hypothetical protein
VDEADAQVSLSANNLGNVCDGAFRRLRLVHN